MLCDNIYDRISKILRNYEYFSLALDETTVKTDISQLCKSIWFRSIDLNFNIKIDILSFKNLHSREVDILK